MSLLVFFFLDKPRQLLARSEFVESPCKPNPCNSTDICVINHRKCRHPETCKTYICKPGEHDEALYLKKRLTPIITIRLNYMKQSQHMLLSQTILFVAFHFLILLAACSLGEVSRSRVAHGSHVMLPNTRQQYCYRACTCSHNSVLSHCEDVGCIRRDSCLINADTIQGKVKANCYCPADFQNRTDSVQVVKGNCF